MLLQSQHPHPTDSSLTLTCVPNNSPVSGDLLCTLVLSPYRIPEPSVTPSSVPGARVRLVTSYGS